MDTQRRFELNRKQSLERARFEADRKYRQFQAVEPENRLVARELERQWESSLKVVESLVREYEMSKVQPLSTSDEQRQAIRSLATSLPRLWRSEFTSNSDRGNGSLKGSQCGSQKGDQLGVGDVGWKWQSKKRPAWQPKSLFWQSKKRPLETKFLMLANSLRINFSFCCSCVLA